LVPLEYLISIGLASELIASTRYDEFDRTIGRYRLVKIEISYHNFALHSFPTGGKCQLREALPTAYCTAMDKFRRKLPVVFGDFEKQLL